MMINNNEKISIIVPVYNVEKYINRCVESILASTYRNIEVILVDDGSVDDSFCVCKSFQEKDGRVRVIHQENAGCTWARKVGISVATGKYIGFVDPDDWIESDMYEVLHTEAAENHAQLVISPFYRNNDTGTYGIFKSSDFDAGIYSGEKLEKIKRNIYVDGKRTVNGSLCNKIFLKDIITELYDMLDNRIYRGEDSVIVVMYLLGCSRIVKTNRAFYHAYDRPGSLTHSVDIEYFAQVNYWYKQVYSYLEESIYKDMICELKKFYITLLAEGILKQSGSSIDYRYEPDTDEHKKVILYGAGKVGRSYYAQFLKSNSVDVILWIDKNADKLGDSRIEMPDKLSEYVDEEVLIAVESANLAKSICKELTDKYGVAKERIKWKEPHNFERLIRKWIYD